MKTPTVFAFKIALLQTLILASLATTQSLAATQARAQELSDSSKKDSLKADSAKLDLSRTNLGNLSPLAKEIAELAGVTAVLQQVVQEQQSLAEKTTAPSLEGKERLIYLRGKLNAFMLAIGAQINSTHSRIELAIAQADELKAYMSEKRNRITRRNSQINLVSGGLTKMSGYSLALGNLNPIPTNVLEVFDGAVQTTLSALALRNQQKEKKLEHGMPPILDSILTGKQTGNQYAPGIWLYLNHIPPGTIGNKTRRELLIESWQRTNVLQESRTAKNRLEEKQIATIDLLDQRLAMLSDLKSEVSEMNNGLMELTNAIALSYSSDPEI